MSEEDSADKKHAAACRNTPLNTDHDCPNKRGHAENPCQTAKQVVMILHGAPALVTISDTWNTIRPQALHIALEKAPLMTVTEDVMHAIIVALKVTLMIVMIAKTAITNQMIVTANHTEHQNHSGYISRS